MDLYNHLLFLFAGVLATLAALAWGYRETSRCARTLFVFLAAEGLACFAYGMNLAAGTLETKLWWSHLEYLSGIAVTPLMPLLALRVTGYDKRPPAWVLIALFAVPVTGAALNWTCQWHDLYYTRLWLQPVGGMQILAKERGPLYSVVFGYVFGLIILACALFAWRLTRRLAKLSREQTVLIGVALSAPLVCGTPYYWMSLPWLKQVNTVHAGFFITALAFSVALFRGRFQSITQALTVAEERNHLLLGHAHAIFYTIAPDGRFTYVSETWTQFVGHQPGEVVGHMYREFVLPEDIPACDAFLAHVVQTGELQSGIEYRVRQKGGPPRWHTSSIKPVLDRQGRAITFVGVAHDITDVKRTQEELLQANERLERLITSREAELRAAVATALDASAAESRRIGQEIHDGLCQELVGLLRMTEGLAKQLDGAAGPQERAMALAGQLGDALRLAREVSYGLTLHDLASLTLPEALAVFARRFESASGVSIELNCAREIGTLAPVEAGHIYRIVREAVVNAIRHGHARHLWIDGVHEDRQVVVSITNDGLPLPPEGKLVSGMGLTQIRMRAGQLGGTFSLKRDAHGKTVAELVMPYVRGGLSNEPTPE